MRLSVCSYNIEIDIYEYIYTQPGARLLRGYSCAHAEIWLLLSFPGARSPAAVDFGNLHSKGQFCPPSQLMTWLSASATIQLSVSTCAPVNSSIWITYL